MKMEAETAAKRKDISPAPAGGALPPIGAKLPSLAPLSETQRSAAAASTMSALKVAAAPASAPASAPQRMEMSASEMEARKAHLLAQRQKIMEKNSVARQKQKDASEQKRHAKQAAEPAPAPSPTPTPTPAPAPTGPRTIEVKQVR